MLRDSTDEFPIIGRAESSAGSDPVETNLDDADWPDEFSVGSAIEIVEVGDSLSIFARVRRFFGRIRGSTHSGQIGIEIDDPADATFDSALTDSRQTQARSGEIRQDLPPGILEARVIERQTGEDRGPAFSPSAERTEQPRQEFEWPKSPHDETSSVAGTIDTAGETRQFADSDSDFVSDALELQEFIFEKDEFLIADTPEVSKSGSWIDAFALPFVMIRAIFGRPASKTDGPEEAEIEIAPKRMLGVRGIRAARGTSGSSVSGEHLPEFSGDSSGAIEEHVDEFRISPEAVVRAASATPNDEFALHDSGDPESTYDDDVVPAFDRKTGFFRTDSAIANEAAAQAGPEDSERDSTGNDGPGIGDTAVTTFSERLENLFETKPSEVEVDLHDELVEPGQISGTPAGAAPDDTRSLVRLALRFLVWFCTIPKRCLTSSGDLSDQNRRNVEPLIAALPAMAAVVTAILSVSTYKAADRFSTSRRFLEASRSSGSAGQRESARLAAIRSCTDNSTPENQFRYALICTRSSEPLEVELGLRLMRTLASPARGNQPDAHLFIAEQILRRIGNSPASLRRNFPLYLSELRAGFQSSPSRYDLLEKLAEGLSELGEEQSLTSIVSPYLDYWPHGHYFLAQVAFSKGDDILRKFHAMAMVRHFRGNTVELESEERYRFRYVISLALAGEFTEAEEISRKYFGSVEKVSMRERLDERIRLIRMITRIEEFPEGTDQDIQALGSELFSNDLTPFHKQAVKRQLLRKGPLRPALLSLCRKLYAERSEVFDADDFVYWAAILRQNQENLEARKFLEKAIEIAPSTDVAANNLANLYYKIEPRDLERAFTLIDGVITRNPDNTIYLETRGQILARLGRDQEAIDDLTRCLVDFPNVPEIHETLSACYRKIGNEVLAKAHQARYEQLNSLAKPPSQEPGA